MGVKAIMTKSTDIIMSMLQNRFEQAQERVNKGEGLSDADLNIVLLKAQQESIKEQQAYSTKIEQKVDNLAQDMHGLRLEMSEFKRDVKQDINDFKQDVKQDINDFKQDVKQDINRLENQLSSFEGKFIRISFVTICLFVALLKLADHFIK